GAFAAHLHQLEGRPVPRPVMPPSFWVASTKPEAALARGQGWQPWQERGWTLAPRDRGPEAGMYCWKGHRSGRPECAEVDSRIARLPAAEETLNRWVQHDGVQLARPEEAMAADGCIPRGHCLERPPAEIPG